MEKNKKLLILLLICTTLFPLISDAQCDTDIFLDKCATNLGSFNYIKSFSLTARPKKKANSEFSYVFSKGSSYMLIVCNENSDGGEMLINLYDREHNLIGSTYDEKTKKHFPDMIYSCSATGVYYIKASYEGAKKGCGMFILGFNKD
jgi:hypothetical protein